MKKGVQTDLTRGPFLWKMILFSIPIILTQLLSNLYSTADLIVVGNFRGDSAIAAVGATGSFISMMNCLFMGMSTGVSVLIAQRIGAKRYDQVEQAIHSAVVLSLIVGTIGSVVCVALTPAVLSLTDVPEAIFDDAVRYARIVYLGYPAVAFYNYSAAAVRASGDTRRPLIFLTVSGVANVVLNAILVAVFGMGVEGVAIATAASNYLSAVLMLRLLLGHEGCLRVYPEKLRMEKHSVLQIMAIGIPSGIQNAMYNLANMMVQTSINAFGEITVAGHTAGANLLNYPYVAQVSVQSAAMTFVGQNIGAKKYKNVKRVLLCGLACSVAVCSFGALLIWLFRDALVGLYVTTPDAAQIAYIRLLIGFASLIIAASAEMFNSVVRAMGKSTVAMVTALVGGVGIRMLWVVFIAPLVPTYAMVAAALPVSSLASLLLILPCYFLYYRKMSRSDALVGLSEA